MGYDRGDSFPFDFEPNGIPFGSKSKGKDFEPNKWIHLVQNRKETCHHDHIPSNFKGNENSFLSEGKLRTNLPNSKK